MVKELNVYVDGGSRGNPGEGAVGAVIKLITKDKNGEIQNVKVLNKIAKRIGVVTNNQAEYRSAIEALKWIRDNKQIKQFANIKIKVYLDSLLVASQLKGVFKIKNAGLRDLLFKVKILEQEINLVILYYHIPREKNKEADFLVNLALDKGSFSR